MLYLIAQGAEVHQRWRRRIPFGRKITLGRAAGIWSTPWDDRISRCHCEVVWQDSVLNVEQLPSAANAIFVRGVAADRFTLKPGQHFVIGSTTFALVEEEAGLTEDAPSPVTELTYSFEQLRQMQFRDSRGRIETLSKIPQMVGAAASEAEMFVRLVNLLLVGIPQATSVAIVHVDGQEIDVLQWDRRDNSTGACAPSKRLIRHAVANCTSVVHTWQAAGDEQGVRFTQAENNDWAFCWPYQEEWAIYVDGSFAPGAGQDADQLQDDLKFTEVAGSTVANLLEVRRLQQRHAALNQFLSPVVLTALEEQDPREVLEPREIEASILFCDLRGFAKSSEQWSSSLMGLLQRVSEALGVMTHAILDEDGVIGDFHGDSAMGFWGWPLTQSDAALRAARAALEIRRCFETARYDNRYALADFRVGIGIASGPAVAGKIGSPDQVKVTAFGPVVNLASRLEGLTKHLRAPILIDEATAAEIRRNLPTDTARVRRLARIRPYGLETPLMVSELLPAALEYPRLSDAHLQAYEQSLDLVQRGDWEAAFEKLHDVPADDRVKDFLTVFIASHNRTAPDQWDGVIPIERK